MNDDIFDIINPTNTLCMSRPLTHIIGALETMVYGALLSKFSYYKKNNMLDDGWFYSTIPDLYESTSLSAFKQKRCIMTLESFGLIETKNRGLPARRSFRIINDTELISNLIAKGVEKCVQLSLKQFYPMRKNAIPLTSLFFQNVAVMKMRTIPCLKKKVKI